jgi:hypothetical protein
MSKKVPLAVHFFGTNKACHRCSHFSNFEKKHDGKPEPARSAETGWSWLQTWTHLSVRMSEAWRVEMKYVLVTVALVFSTSAFAAVDASPPTELPGCELVGTVKNVKIWAGECEPSIRNGVPVGSNVVPVRPPPTQPGGSSKK